MNEPDPNERDVQVRVTRLADQGRETDLQYTTVEERWAMMWQLALKGESVETPLPRHLERIIRGRLED
jgi:hypothetical protein